GLRSGPACLLLRPGPGDPHPDVAGLWRPEVRPGVAGRGDQGAAGARVHVANLVHALKNLLKEPLVHFLAGSVLVFGFFWTTGSDRDPADYQVRIDAADIERLQVGWVQRFRRAPTTEELDSLIDQEIKEEIYYREALRLGLDRNDPLIRRRLHTKLRFLDHQEDATGDPPDAVLVEWMARFPDKY